MRFLQHNDEGFYWSRMKPTEPYRRTQAVLWLPKPALQLTVLVLCGYRRLEAACYWYGLRDCGENSFVKAVVVPFQRNTWGNYHVSKKSISEMSTKTRTHGWVCLSQVHSHPGSMVEHSSYDDEHASSQRILSVVFPKYGRWHSDWPMEIGVHEWQNGYWHCLSDEDATCRVRLEAGMTEMSLIDMRQ